MQLFPLARLSRFTAYGDTGGKPKLDNSEQKLRVHVFFFFLHFYFLSIIRDALARNANKLTEIFSG